MTYMFLKRITLLRDEIPSFNQYPFSIPIITRLLKYFLQNRERFLEEIFLEDDK
jgi:predicted ATPase